MSFIYDPHGVGIYLPQQRYAGQMRRDGTILKQTLRKKIFIYQQRHQIVLMESRTHTQNLTLNRIVPLFYGPHDIGIYLHEERNTGQTRRDGTVPKPSMLERYFHRPGDEIFDNMDLVTYHTEFKAAKNPPNYAQGELWTETDWETEHHRLQVFRRRQCASVSQKKFRNTFPPTSIFFFFQNTETILSRMSTTMLVLHVIKYMTVTRSTSTNLLHNTSIN